MSLRPLILISALLIVQSSSQRTQAQEVDCKIQVNYESVASTNKDRLQSFASDVSDYVNNYRWGPDDLAEKVKCTMNIFVQSVIGEDRYQAQVFVGSQRRVYDSEKSTAVVRLFDEQWEFTYVRTQPLSHNSYSFNDLSSFLDFYIYIVLGYDYDTYDALSGTPLFQKAADIANLGRASGLKGWQLSTTAYSRAKLIDELQNPRYEPVRRASYRYHFRGLDSLSLNPARAYANMLQAVETIGEVKKQADPRNVVIKAFFDTKYMELADVFQKYPQASVYLLFSQIDPSHQSTYDQYYRRKEE